MSYKEQRLDQRWKDKSAHIKSEADHKCAKCGSTEQLTTHHGYYHPGKKVWEYDDATLWCLCWLCHNELQAILTDIHIRIATINPKHYAELLTTVQENTLQFNPAMTEPEIAELVAEILAEEAVRFAAYSAILYENNDLGGSLSSEVASEANKLFSGLTIDIVPDSSHRDCTASVDGPDDETRKEIQAWFDYRQQNT